MMQFFKPISASPVTVTDRASLSPQQLASHSKILELKEAIGAIDKGLHLTHPNLIDYYQSLMGQLDKRIEKNILRINYLSQLLHAYHLSDEHRQIIASYLEHDPKEISNLIHLLGSSDLSIADFVDVQKDMLSAQEKEILQQPLIFRKWLIEILRDEPNLSRHFMMLSVKLDDDQEFRQDYMQEELEELQYLHQEYSILDKQFRIFKLKFERVLKPKTELVSCLSQKREIDSIKVMELEEAYGYFVHTEEDSKKQISRNSPTLAFNPMNFKSA
jgi:hypothetical protein